MKNQNTKDEEDILKRQQEWINQENKKLGESIQETEEKKQPFLKQQQNKDQEELVSMLLFICNKKGIWFEHDSFYFHQHSFFNSKQQNATQKIFFIINSIIF